MKKRNPKYTTVGVLFAGNRKVYTYRAPLRHGIKLGDEIVVDSPWEGPKIVFVVRLDKTPVVPAGYQLDTLKAVRGRVVPV